MYLNPSVPLRYRSPLRSLDPSPTSYGLEGPVRFLDLKEDYRYPSVTSLNLSNSSLLYGTYRETDEMGVFLPYIDTRHPHFPSRYPSLNYVSVLNRSGDFDP